MASFLLLSGYVPDGGYKNEIYQEYVNYPGDYRRVRNRDWMLVPQNCGRDLDSGPGSRNGSSARGSSGAGSGDEFDHNHYDD